MMPLKGGLEFTSRGSQIDTVNSVHKRFLDLEGGMEQLCQGDLGVCRL